MSMICNFRQVSLEQMKIIKKDPSILEAFLFELPEEKIMAYDLPDNVKENLLNNIKNQMGSIIGEMKKEVDALKKYVGFENIEKEKSIDIDKAWHGIHFLLTGEPWEGEKPFSNVIMGGKEIGEDMGYGPAKYLTPGEVKEIVLALESITSQEIKKRYREKISEIKKIELYVVCSGEEGEEDYLAGYYEKLKKYYIEAAQKGKGMLIYMN